MGNIVEKEDVRQALDSKLSRYFGVGADEATKAQVYKAVILTVKDILTNKRSAYRHEMKKQQSKRVYYLCMEFLIGRSLKNNLGNLGLTAAYTEALSDMGFDINDFYEMEPDPGLGNGGLGRLAACFMDSLATLDYAATGFSLC